MVYITKINLLNFRCYKNKQFVFKKGINVVCGDNATGKTSLMEALYISGMGKSYRTNSDADIVSYDNDFYSILVNVAENDTEKEEKISIVYSNVGKKISKNGVIFKSLSQYIGYFNVVIFSPDDLKLIKGEPKYRRKFLDINISQINKEYLNALTEYNKILKERNELLKQINYDGKFISQANKAMLDIYTNVLITNGKVLINNRRAFVTEINKYIQENVKNIAKNNEEGWISYLPNVNEENIEQEFKKREINDLFAGTTTVGPHRDDFETFINNKHANDFASQGQQRTLALAVKVGLAMLMSELKKDVVVIIDDVFGELDEKRQKELMEILKKHEQIFITTTSMKYLTEDVIKESNIIKL